jgi:mono/diheme cytochrome c family protein
VRWKNILRVSLNTLRTLFCNSIKGEDAMKKVLKWIGIVLGGLIGLLMVAGVMMFFLGSSRLTRTYDFPASGVVVPTDAASIESGKHRVQALCTDCHGADLGGVAGWTSVGPLATIDSANLTSGEGGIAEEFSTDEDYVNAIRHGIDPEGMPIYMPAVVAFQYISDDDLGAMIAYLKTIPPVDRKTNGSQFSALGKIIVGAGMFGNLPVEEVSHQNNVSAPEAGVTPEYGGYLVDTGDCRACHGQELAGGSYPDPSVTQPVPNLTPGGELGFWTESQFIQTMRTGFTPSGHVIDAKLMPVQQIGSLTDAELQAIWMYLQSLPKTATQTK